MVGRCIQDVVDGASAQYVLVGITYVAGGQWMLKMLEERSGQQRKRARSERTLKARIWSWITFWQLFSLFSVLWFREEGRENIWFGQSMLMTSRESEGWEHLNLEKSTASGAIWFHRLGYGRGQLEQDNVLKTHQTRGGPCVCRETDYWKDSGGTMHVAGVEGGRTSW